MSRDLGLLLLRLTAGGMLLGHGAGKVMDLIAGKTDFPDPLGIGPLASLALAAFAEFGCSLAVMIGFKTRLAAIPVVITMLVAAFVFHAGDSFGDRELPLLYASAFLALALTGGGEYSLDTYLVKRRT